MSNVQFPPNPENGMIFEAIPGIFYKYNAGSNCWNRLKGVESLGLATPLSNGLMSKEDFSKLQNLVLPPPQATIKGEECNTTFKSGTISLNSFDESLKISKNLRTLNKTPQGIVETETPWKLHQNTAGFDFKVPINRLLQEIEQRNLLKKVQLQGDQGAKGPRGEAGKDRLDTGPIGLPGEDGTNSPFSGGLVNEGIPFETTNNSNRAIVDISVEEISEDENYLIATRANIGNPDACPALISPKDFNSALVVALNTLQGGKLIKDQVISSTDCALICRVCASSIHHLNIQDIMDLIFEHFSLRVNRLKEEKEKLVKAWLGTMVSLFNEQKSALCCALENCLSRGRNERTRQYIETQRIQAALGDFQLIIDGEDDHKVTNMDGHKNCPIPVESVPGVEVEGDCTRINLDSKIHISDPRANSSQAVTTFFPRGVYIAEVTSCCPNLNASFNNPRYSGRAAVLYRAVSSLGDGTSISESVETRTISFPDFGTFENVSAARNAYQGLTLSFEHAGGDVSFWMLDADGFTANNDGVLTITIKNASTLEEQPTADEANGFLYVYRDEISFNGLLGRITPFTGILSASDNFGSISDEVDLTVGPALLKDRAQVFFYDGADGLSLFFVAGEQAGPDNDQQASLLIDVDVTNNSSALAERASDSETDVKRLSASQFQVSATVSGDSAGFAVGEFDPNAEYSIRVDPRDLSSMRSFVAASSDGDTIIISQGGSEGIGGNISVTQINSAPIAGVLNVPTQYGGGNTDGLRLNNESSGQNVTLTRPIALNVPATVGDVQLILQDLATGVQFAYLNPDGAITTAPQVQAIPDFRTFGISASGSSVTGAADALPPDVQIRTFGFADQDFADSGWQATVRERFKGGSSSTVRRAQNGNPGPFRETTHSSEAEQRVFAGAGRPTKSFFGPGSTGALHWTHFYASDQFGNGWLAVRDTREDISRGLTGANLLDNGANAIYLRDVTAEDLSIYAGNFGTDQLSVNTLGGLSGLEPGTVAASWTNEKIPPYSSIITTYHVQQEAIFNPAANGAINNLSFSADARLIPAATNASSVATIPPPTPPPPPAPLPQEQVDALLEERIDVLNQIDVVNQQIATIATIPVSSEKTIGQLNNQKIALQTRIAQIDQILAANSAAIAAANTPQPIQQQAGATGAPIISGDYFVGVVISQNGNIYRGPGIIVNNANWTTRAQGRLGAGSFSLVVSGGSFGGGAPDFSTGGALINLGYFVESNHNQGNDARTIGVDNWGIDVGAEFVPPPKPDATIPQEIITDKGGFVNEVASSLPRGALGSPQDPCIIDVCASIRTSAPQSLRYILTDKDGNKYFSSYRSINVELLDRFQLFSFGPSIAIIAPPEEFTSEIISGQNLDLTLVSNRLSAEQLRKAESLDGIARLTFVQELLGAPTSVLPNGRMMTDIEIEFRSMPYSSVDFGFLSIKVGIPGSIAEIIVDNFRVQSEIVGETIGQPERITSSIKRVVATQTGSDSSTTGLIYSGFDSYYGDYTSVEGLPNFYGNNFFALNQAGQQRLAHVNSRTGFQNVISSSGSILTTNSGNVTGPDAIAVDDFGVVYVADGPGGRVDAYLASNASINNTSYGDAFGGVNPISKGIPGNTVFKVSGIPLPVTDQAAIAIGRYKTIGPSLANDLIANFNGRWYKIDSIQRLLFKKGPAAREDITTPRCCFGADNPPGPARSIAVGAPTGSVTALGTSPRGSSFTTNAPANPQPTLPVPTSNIGQAIVEAVQAQLDNEFNQFEFYSLDEGNVYEVNPQTGTRTLVQELGENAFSLRAHPRTKDLYYIVNNRGTTPVSGTTIRRLDISDLDVNGRPRIKTVFNTENNEGIFGITFGNSVPSDPTLQNQVLYALLSTLENQDSGNSVSVRIVEIAELVTPPIPSMPISGEIPLNSIWNTSVSGGRLLGNPSRVIFSRLTPGGGCQMHYKQVQWYERGWRIGACCGALVELSGVYYVVVKRSIGTDTSCGGGESLGTSCIRQFIDTGEGHPAIAWPTIPPDLLGVPGGGGEEFLGLPTSGFVNFVKDETLSNDLLAAIRSGNTLRTIGRPSTEIPFILFPAA